MLVTIRGFDRIAHVEWALHCIPDAEHCDLHAGGHLIWVGKDAERMRGERTAFLRRHFDSATIQ
jgi:hypothetical protein